MKRYTRTLGAACCALTLYVGPLQASTSNDSSPLTLPPGPNIGAEVTKLEQMTEQLRLLAIQIEAGDIDQAMAERRNQHEHAIYTTMRLEMLARQLPSMTFAYEDNQIPVTKIIEGLKQFTTDLEAADAADLKHLQELEAQLPEGISLDTPLLTASGQAAYRELLQILEESEVQE